MKRSTMKKCTGIIFCILTFPFLLLGQEVGSGADVPSEGHAALAFTYENLSRHFTIDGFEEKVKREILRATFSFRPAQNWNLYVFTGTSDFPNSFADSGNHLYYGGGIKYMMLGEVDIEEEDGSSINIRIGIGLDFQVSHLQSMGHDSYKKLGLTEFQGAIDFGVRVFQFAGYLGFKFSGISGDFTLADERKMDAQGKGLFSMFLGLNLPLSRRLAFVSEYSLFTERSWALGLRFNI